MKAPLKDLAAKLLGNITDHPDVLEHFSTDGSPFRVTPIAAIFPANTADVRKLVQWAAERTEAGKPVSLTARGGGTGTSGAALGDGLQVVFPTHMHKLLRLERDYVVVQPGISAHTLQQTLYTHGRFIPVLPHRAGPATVGGLVAGNAATAASVKYGPIGAFVKTLKVVLADGSLIETRRLSARELNRRKGFTTMEGEIYRKVDSILLDHAELIRSRAPRTSLNVAGYNLAGLKRPDGSIDLTPLFVGAQGTLGLITEITLKTLPYNPRTTLLAGYMSALDKAGEAVAKLRALGPSAIELVDDQLLDYLADHRPGDLEGLVPAPRPRVMLLVEFNDYSQLAQKWRSTRAERLLRRYGGATRVAIDPVEQVALWKIRRSAASLLAMTGTTRKPVPIIDDAAVPVARLADFLARSRKLLEKHKVAAMVWGHAGDGRLHFQPAFNLTQKHEVDRLLHLSHEFHDLVAALGGTPSASAGDGLLRGTYLARLYGEDAAELHAATKHALDPYGLFSPYHKTGATEAFARDHLRADYTAKPLFEHI